MNSRLPVSVQDAAQARGCEAIASAPETVPLHPVLRGLFAALERRNVRWALLRVPEGGLIAPRGDIDVLIDPRDTASAIGVLTALDFIRIPRRNEGIHFLQYCAPTDQWLWVHAVTTLGFGRAHPLVVSGERGCLSRRRVAGGVAQLPADAAFWLLLWHGLAVKGQLAVHHRTALEELWGSADARSETAETFAAACGGDRTLPERLIGAVRRGNWGAVDAHAPACTRARVRAERGSVVARIVRGFRRLADGVWRGWGRRGVTVALLGPDGAGKSTLAAGIRASIPFPSLFLYMGLTGGALVYAHRLRVPGLVFAVSAAIIWRRYLRGRYHQARGRLVVFDRYIYDAVTPHPRHQRFWQRVARSVMGRICPGPDLVLLLDAPGTVMFSRKSEYDPAMLEDWRQHFRLLADRLPQLEIIDATRDADAVRIDAVARIWQRYAERWRTPIASRDTSSHER